MEHLSNGSYQLLKKDPTIKIKTKTLKQLKALKKNEFIDNKLKMKIATPILSGFPITSEMFPLQAMRK